MSIGRHVHSDKLSNEQFIALRSMCRSAWVDRGQQGMIFDWKRNGYWWTVQSGGRAWRLADQGTAAGGGYISGREFPDDVEWRAISALRVLERRGLAKSAFRRCCPGRDCHANDETSYEPTEAGRAFVATLKRASPPHPRLAPRTASRWRFLRKPLGRLISAFKRPVAAVQCDAIGPRSPC
jgi:hypothetical protein